MRDEHVKGTTRVRSNTEIGISFSYIFCSDLNKTTNEIAKTNMRRTRTVEFPDSISAGMFVLES